MANPFGDPVETPNNSFNPMTAVQTLSGILGLKQQQQAIAGQAAQVQQEQQTAKQRSALANVFSSFDPTQHVGADGTLDLDNVLTDPKLRQAAGDQFPAVMEQMLKVKQGQITAKQQLANLNDTLRNQFSSTVGSLRTDPEVVKDSPLGRQKVQQAMGDFAETGGPDAARVANTYAQVLNHTPQGKLSQNLSNFQLQAMDASTQAGRQAPSYTDTGSSLQNTNPQAAGGNLGKTQSLSRGIPPGFQLTEDPVTHNKYLINQQTGESRPLGEGAPVGGGGKAPPQRAAGQGEGDINVAKADADTYNQISSEGKNAQTGMVLARQVSDLSDQVRTGKLSKEWTDRLAVLAQDNPSITARQMLSKYAAQLKTMATAGASTDQSRSQIDEGMPSPETMNPKAVKEAAQYVGGIFQMRQARQAHADQYVQGRGGSLGLQGVDNAYMRAADPLLFTYKSLQPGQERQDFLRKHGITTPQRQQDFLSRMNQVDHLGNQ